MSAAKHTPGPWFIFGNGHCVGGANTDPTTAAEHSTAGVAMCGMARRLPDECAANACLIAAAPDLLAALQAAKNSLVAFKFMPGPGNAWEDHDEANLQAVDAAMTKATGIAAASAADLIAAVDKALAARRFQP